MQPGVSIIVALAALAAPPSADAQIEFLRTPDSRFADLDGYDFAPNYAYVDDYEGGQLRMHYIDEGPADGPTVLMLHGNPTWAYQFRDVIPRLNAAGYRTIAVDLVGMGRSDKPTDESDHTYDRHVGWVTQLFTQLDSQLDLGQVSVFGHDYGTPIGVRMMAESFPDRFDAFIDANASLPDGTSISPVHQNWRKFVRDNPDVPIGHVISGAGKNSLTPEEIYGYYAPWPGEEYKAAIRAFPEMVPDDPTRPEAIANNAAWTFLESFEKPFMTIFGQVDSPAFDARRDFIERVPGAYGQPQPQLDVTHYAPEDDPEGVAREVVRLLDDVYQLGSFAEFLETDFVSGFDGYTPGGPNVSYDGATQSVRIGGGDGQASSLVSADTIDLAAIDVLKVAFRYEAESMEAGERLAVELWNGSGWSELLSLVAGADFQNDVWDYGFVRIEAEDYGEATDAKVRFRNLASAGNDAVRLLDVSVFTVPALDGDFNLDGAVDAADYTVWRDGFGTTYNLDDYSAWTNNYGATARASSTAVPEPTTAALSTVALGAASFSRRGRQQGRGVRTASQNSHEGEASHRRMGLQL